MSDKIEKNSVFVSIDLCKDYSQEAYCFTNSMSGPESVSVIAGDQKYIVPTVVGRLNDMGGFCIGEDALLRSKRGEAELSSDIFSAILGEKKVTIGEKDYGAEEILKEFIAGMLSLCGPYHIGKADKIVVTVEYPDRILVNVVRKVLMELGFGDECIKVIGHSESIIYYTIFQKKELWVNDVLIFDFTKHQFLVRRLSTVRARLPQPVIVEEKDLSSKYSVEMLDTEEGCMDMDRQFLLLLKELCGKHIVSTVYLTGVGFYENWMKDSIRYLCSKRRVFQGYNLFVKGACYAAISESGIGNADNFQFVCSGRTLVNIELEVEKGDKIVPVVLSKAGVNWYEAGARAEGILDRTKEIRLRIHSSVSKNSKIINISLMEFPSRPNKNTRIEIILSYKNDRQCIVMIRDLGFGEFFKSGGETVREVINIEDYI